MHLKTCPAVRVARAKSGPFDASPRHDASTSGSGKVPPRKQSQVTEASRPASPPLPAQVRQQATRPTSPPLPAQAKQQGYRPASPQLPAQAKQQAYRPSSPPLPVAAKAEDRPPSPPIAAAASQAEPFSEDVDSEPLDACPHCARTFRRKVLERHIGICQKVFMEKRKAFDAVANAIPQEAVKAKKVQERQEKQEKKKTSKTEINDQKQKEGEGGAPAWLKKSEAFRAAIKSARVVTQYVKEGKSLKDLPPPPVTDPSLDDRTPCPHCGRRFGSSQAERHIPLCAAKTKKKGR